MVEVTVNNKKQDLIMAAILDEFSNKCYKEECELVYLEPSHWKTQLISEKPHLLFVESVWHGLNGEWRSKRGSFEKGINKDLKHIVKWCKKNNIPTVFWNKEDPIHFEKFIKTAKLFDYIFTTDINCIDKYRKIIKHNRIYVLPFAAQPRIHNPINRTKTRLGKIAFAGSWHSHKHPERNKDMDIILNPALEYDLTIYDRNYYRNNRYLRFPKEYQPFIKGGLTYGEMVERYKKYDVFLNVNSVKNSSTMFSRRVFELLASGVNVISGFSIGIEKMLPGLIPLCKNREDTIKYLDILLSDRELSEQLSLLGQREIFNKHTYEHRLVYVLEKVGIYPVKKSIPGVSIITWINKMEDANSVLENYRQQIYEKKELIIIIRNNEISFKELYNKINKDDYINIYLFYEHCTFGDCLDFLINKVRYKYVSIFSPHSYYGPEFIGDLMNVFKYAETDIAGKKTYYVYKKENKELSIALPSNEYQYTNFLNPYAMIIRRNVFKKVKYGLKSHNEIAESINEWNEKGIKMYSADRFNYVYIFSKTNQNEFQEMDRQLLFNKNTKLPVTEDYKTAINV